MRLVPRSPRPEVFAVGVDDAQLIVRPGPEGGEILIDGAVVARIEPSERTIAAVTVAVGPTVSGRRLQVSGAGSDVTLDLLERPPGAELCRFATVNDLHLGSRVFGLTHRIVDPPGGDSMASRCAHAAFAEATAWGAQRLFVKGDIVHKGGAGEWAMLTDLLASARVPVHMVPGNHEVAHGRHHRSRRNLAALGHAIEPSSVVELDGIRIVLVDTTTDDSHDGRIGHVRDDVLDAVSDGSPVIVMHHHQLHPTPLPPIYPPGIWGDDVRRLLRDVAAVSDNVVFSSGHSHRHRRRRHRGITLVEAGSTKDYPGTWCGYVVYEGGIVQTVRRIADPVALEWTERTGEALLGWWSRWSPGTLSDRSWAQRWS